MFTLVLGKENNVLPGKLWAEYSVEVLPDKMVCFSKKEAVKIEIYYSSFHTAEFGIGNGNLWLQCELDEGDLVFCAPRKSWKSVEGKMLVEHIAKYCNIAGEKNYKQYIGPFFFLAILK